MFFFQAEDGIRDLVRSRGLGDVYKRQDVSDKLLHFGAYGLLSGLLFLNLHFQNKFQLLKKYPATLTVLIASSYGFFDEIHQMFVPGRSAEFLDWLADFSGSLLAVLITGYLIKKIKEFELKEV